MTIRPWLPLAFESGDSPGWIFRVFVLVALMFAVSFEATSGQTAGANPTNPGAAITSQATATTPLNDAATVILVAGVEGEAEYQVLFRQWAANWSNACQQAGVRCLAIGLTNHPHQTDNALFQNLLQNQSHTNPAPLWIVLIGHGTFDDREAKFNLRGPDLTATELAAWLKPFQRPLIIINTASASGPFLPVLSAPGRVVITATRSGHEQSFARFGGYLATALVNPVADLDKDGQTSLLEAFLMASRATAEFYKVEGRLASEHPLLDDNGDRLGTPADWFRGIRPVQQPEQKGALDGLRAHQVHLLPNPAERQWSQRKLARRDALEQTIATLREQKKQLGESEYYARLEPILMELAALYETPETPASAGPSTKPGSE